MGLQISNNLNPRVCIGVSVYQQKLEDLVQCLTSLHRQTYDNIEIIIRLDGADASSSEVRHYLQTEQLLCPRRNISLLIDPDNIGTFASYAKIFASSSSDLICQVDADDFLDHRTIELCVDVFRQHDQLAFVYTDCLEVDEFSTPIGLRKGNLVPLDDRSQLVEFITYHLRVVNRHAYLAVGGYSGSYRYAGDYDLSLRLLEVGSVAKLSRPLYFYRVHMQSASQKNTYLTNLEAKRAVESALVRRGLNHSLRLDCDLSTGAMTLIPRQE